MKHVSTRRFLALCLAFLLCVLQIPSVFCAQASSPFQDVTDPSAYYYEPVLYVTEQGWMVGVSQDRFSPQGVLTRGQIVTIFYRMAGQPDTIEGTPFQDLTKSYYIPAVCWAAAIGLTQGTSDTTFSPDRPVTRQELAAFFFRFYRLSHEIEAQDSLTSFPDASSVSPYARKAVSWAVSAGLIQGVAVRDSVLLKPEASSNRAQIAAILMRFLSRFPDAVPEQPTPTEPVPTQSVEPTVPGETVAPTTPTYPTEPSVPSTTVPAPTVPEVSWTTSLVFNREAEQTGQLPVDVTAEDFLTQFQIGDVLLLQLEEQTLELPVCISAGHVDYLDYVLVVDADADTVTLCRNKRHAGTDLGILEKTDGRYDPVSAGTFPLRVQLSLLRRGGYLDGIRAHSLLRSYKRSAYPDLTDWEFANFRAVTTANIAKGALYRSSSPIDPKLGRNQYADEAARRAGVTCFFNLADSEKNALERSGYTETYYSTQHVVFLPMTTDYTAVSFREGIRDMLRCMASREGPYLIHCTEGKDRAGLASALVEAFMGASVCEIRSDYLTSFRNYFQVSQEIHTGLDDAILEIRGQSILKYLSDVLHCEIQDQTELAPYAKAFFIELGLTETELNTIYVHLSHDPHPLLDWERSDRREDYPELTEEEFANFRMITTTGMRTGLYRGQTPLTDYERAKITMAALERNGVSCILNLSDPQAALENYSGYPDSYYAAQNVICLDMDWSYETTETMDKIGEGLRFIAQNAGPYFIHCSLGRDRTGFFAALLEALMGASFDEIVEDYQKTFKNLYAIEKTDQGKTHVIMTQYQLDRITEDYLLRSMERAFQTQDLQHADLKKLAEDYILRCGLSESELNEVILHLK